MKYVRQSAIIFGITMIGELLNTLLPLPVPAGVYGLFLLLIGLCTGILKLSDVEETGGFLLDTMPIMFVPVIVGLIENYELMKTLAVPLVVISAASTVIVMAVTGKMTELFISMTHRKENHS